jgi:hypothetical protein
MILGRIYNAVEPDGFLLIPLSKVMNTVWCLMYHWQREMWYVDNFEYNTFFGQHYSLQFAPREVKKITWKNTTPMASVIRHQTFRAIFR